MLSRCWFLHFRSIFLFLWFCYFVRSTRSQIGEQTRACEHNTFTVVSEYRPHMDGRREISDLFRKLPSQQTENSICPNTHNHYIGIFGICFYQHQQELCVCLLLRCFYLELNGETRVCLHCRCEDQILLWLIINIVV